MSAFRVGQKVVCVNGDPFAFVPSSMCTDDGCHVTKGIVYTIRAVGTCPAWNKPAVWLREVYRPLTIFGEVGYSPLRFRPVAYPKQSLEHDVEAFRRIATRLPAPEKESAE